MSRHDFFEGAILYILNIAFFFGLNGLLSVYVPYAHIISFAVTLLLFIIFHESLLIIIRKIITRQYYLLLNKTQQILEELNSSLNSAYRYHDVIKTLFNTFKLMFGEIPHAFYILENDKYYLSHYASIADRELLSLDLKAEYFRNIAPNKLVAPLKQTEVPAKLRKTMGKARLTSVLPFQGHHQHFGLLLTDHEAISFFSDRATRRLFEKIQKKAGLILENTALFIDLEKKNFETRKLIEVSQKILSSFDTKNILDFILNTLKSIINYDAAAIFLLDSKGKRLLNTSHTGYDQSSINRLHLKVGQGSCGWVAESKQIEVLDDVRNAQHYFELRPPTRSQISLPLIYDDHVLGVICLESDRISFFNQNLVDILKVFGHLASIAIHNARQMDIFLAKKALEHELVNAGTVQKGLLVQQIPRIRQLSLIAENIPSKIVSGDLYDVIRYNENTAGIAIGDVSGKGAPAALMMALILAGLRSQKKNYLTVCDVVYRLNELLYESTIEGKYASFFYCIVIVEENKLIYTNAGHNPPLLVTREGKIKELTKGGIVLGFVQNTEYIQDELEFRSGDMLVAYTDGITESMNASEEEFGEQRLIRIVKNNRHLPVFEIKTKVFKEVRKFSGMEAQTDDMTLVICKHD